MRRVRRCDIGERVLEGELMDDPGLDPGRHRHALRGLARINRASAASRPIAHAIREAQARLGRRVRVVDVAAGSGDVAIGAARRCGVACELVLTDISGIALEAAADRAHAAGVEVLTEPLDVFAGSMPEGDLLICTLFLHHLRDDEAVGVLSRMREACNDSVLVSDLRRGAWGTGLASVVPRVLTRSPVVHVDAVRSARAAWSIPEMRALADRAGLEGAGIEACFPARMLMRWIRESVP
ncbi:MAG: methyltransferase domain-containing protein [Planctomycetota bacterium]